MGRCSSRRRSWGECLCRGGAWAFNIKEGEGRKLAFPPLMVGSERACALNFASSRKRTRSATSGGRKEHYLGYLRGVSGRNIVVGEFKDSGLYFQHSQIIFGNACPGF